jgi:hypothetical protein
MFRCRYRLCCQAAVHPLNSITYVCDGLNAPNVVLSGEVDETILFPFRQQIVVPLKMIFVTQLVHVVPIALMFDILSV